VDEHLDAGLASEEQLRAIAAGEVELTMAEHRDESRLPTHSTRNRR
jgi:hypothetical protein